MERATACFPNYSYAQHLLGRNAMKLFTIGHSAHSLEKLVHLLDENGVIMLVDVRTTPASRYQPQFNKANLEQLLPQHYIQYVFAGKCLGGTNRFNCKTFETSSCVASVVVTDRKDVNGLEYPAAFRPENKQMGNNTLIA